MRILMTLAILVAFSDVKAPLYPTLPGGNAASICSRATAINTIADVRLEDSHANSISAAFLLTVNDRGKYNAVAVEYQTYGGAELIQFFYMAHMNWLMSFKGNARDILRRDMQVNDMKIVPAQLRPVADGAPLRRILCHGRVA